MLELNTHVDCKECGQLFKCITNKHLIKHNLTLELYKIKYPEAPILSEFSLNRLRNIAQQSNSNRKGVPLSNITKEKISKVKRENKNIAWNKGKPRTEEQNSKLSERKKQLYADGSIVHWNKGKITSKETKIKISTTTKNQKRIYSQISIQKRNITLDKKKLMGWDPGANRRGIKITNPEVLAKIREASKRSNLKRLEKGLQYIQDICDQSNLILKYIENNYWVNLQCKVCDTEFTYTRQIFRPYKQKTDTLCPTCYPRLSGVSNKEIEFAEFIRNVYSGKCVTNDRIVLAGKELDVYLPDIGLAFEFNGLYWHSELNYLGNKHHLSYKQQYAYSKGVRLIHIFEDEWDNKQEIVKSRIRHILNYSRRTIYARKCDIKQISSIDKNTFLQENHIMGADVSGIRYGAFYDNELVGVMTFTPTNYVKGGDGSCYELNRFSILKDVHVSGLASKMFKKFIIEYQPSKVLSYCDRRWNAGDSYGAMGFKLISTTPPSYWYMDKYINRLHRSNFMKHKIITDDIDINNTEWQIMQDKGFDRIWDCGNLKFQWDNPKMSV